MKTNKTTTTTKNNEIKSKISLPTASKQELKMSENVSRDF